VSGPQTIVVTGATRGIGLGLARELLARGSRVVICGRSQESVDKALATLGAGERATGIPADVSRRDDVQRVWDHAIATYGRVDQWVNNAGMSVIRKPLDQVPVDAATAIVHTNLLGVINGTAVSMTGMKKQGAGVIWNMEGFGSNGMKAKNLALYGATKRAVTYFTESLAKDTKDSPVSVCFLSPGIVLTDLLVDDYEGQPAELEKAKKFFNILGDRVETVTPFLAAGILEPHKSGDRVAWLTRGKAGSRFFEAFVLRKKRDIFAEG
jgi:NAD(P)-dependent dehydrogenase (short-subunit alcohol dehydrogenase family)